jgi:hypothetical protein
MNAPQAANQKEGYSPEALGSLLNDFTRHPAAVPHSAVIE